MGAESICPHCGSTLEGDPLAFDKPMRGAQCGPVEPAPGTAPAAGMRNEFQPTSLAEQAAAASAKEKAGMAVGAAVAIFLALKLGRGCLAERQAVEELRERQGAQQRRVEEQFRAMQGKGFQIMPAKK